MFARAALAILAATLVAACADLPAAPGDAARRGAPGSPARDGAEVIRFEVSGLTGVHAATFGNYTFTVGLVTQIADLAFCGGTTRIAERDGAYRLQRVIGPTGIVHSLERLTEPATIVVPVVAVVTDRSNTWAGVGGGTA